MKARFITLLFLLGLFSHILLGQQLVYIESGEIGRGILKVRSGECFVITPAHVVENGAPPFQIWGDRNVLSKGELVGVYEHDLAIIRITEGGKQNCEAWDIAPNYNKILAEGVEGFLEVAQTDGSIQVMKVFLSEKGSTYITFRPYFPDVQIGKGMSGSSLFTRINEKKIFLGMLVSIIDPTTGVVLPASVMDKVLSSFFEIPNNLSETKLTEVAVIAVKGNTLDAFELAQKASDVLNKQYPNYSFVPYEKGKFPNNKATCEISELTENDSENRIDEKIYKYKSQVVLTVRNNGQLISRETLNGGGTDYSKESAQALSIMRTLESTEKLKFEKR